MLHPACPARGTHSHWRRDCQILFTPFGFGSGSFILQQEGLSSVTHCICARLRD